MNQFIRRPEFVRSLEFWTATSIFIVAVFFLITYALTGDTSGIPVSDVTSIGQVPESYYRLYFFPQLIQYALLYGAFLLLAFVVTPRIVRRKMPALDIAFGIVIILLLGAGLGTTDTYLKHHVLRSYGNIESAWAFLFRERILYAVWLAIIFGIYSAAKQALVHVLVRFEEYERRAPWLTIGGLVAAIMWVISLFFLVALIRDAHVIAVWSIFPPSTLLLYWYATYLLIPRSMARKRPFRSYLWRVVLLAIASFLPLSGIASLISTDLDKGFQAGILNSVFQFLVTAPVTWVIYMRSMKGAEEVRDLREKLGHSKASIDFLRSQINPHFLFNALNTIYGTAIQEGADRSAEGVQRLGDMMRFMLVENMQEAIPLSREIEYLHNYIALQRLRTDSHPGISLRTDIEQVVHTATIAPMLLIPFVENAFKHGISFREPSYIKIGLELRGEVLNFDVHNSRHIKAEADPERDHSGIGLANVRQRLELLYPGKHELITRETGKEFFVHLTIGLG